MERELSFCLQFILATDVSHCEIGTKAYVSLCLSVYLTVCLYVNFHVKIQAPVIGLNEALAVTHTHSLSGVCVCVCVCVCTYMFHTHTHEHIQTIGTFIAIVLLIAKTIPCNKTISLSYVFHILGLYMSYLSFRIFGCHTILIRISSWH